MMVFILQDLAKDQEDPELKEMADILIYLQEVIDTTLQDLVQMQEKTDIMDL